jgi:hypothetical protein
MQGLIDFQPQDNQGVIMASMLGGGQAPQEIRKDPSLAQVLHGVERGIDALGDAIGDLAAKLDPVLANPVPRSTSACTSACTCAFYRKPAAILLQLLGAKMQFTANVSGLTPKGYDPILNGLVGITPEMIHEQGGLELRAIDGNRFDAYAVGVFFKDTQIGWIPAKFARKPELWQLLKDGGTAEVTVTGVEPGARYHMLVIRVEALPNDEGGDAYLAGILAKVDRQNSDEAREAGSMPHGLPYEGNVTPITPPEPEPFQGGGGTFDGAGASGNFESSSDSSSSSSSSDSGGGDSGSSSDSGGSSSSD